MPAGYLSGDCHQEVIQATIDNAIDFARSQIGHGKSMKCCLDCGCEIPEERRDVVPGCKYCIKCQPSHDKSINVGYNRSAGHDSQLR